MKSNGASIVKVAEGYRRQICRAFEVYKERVKPDPEDDGGGP